jgi:hypothetical protein
LKENALYKAIEEYDIPNEADSSVLKDEEIVLCYDENKKKELLGQVVLHIGTAPMSDYLNLLQIILIYRHRK